MDDYTMQNVSIPGGLDWGDLNFSHNCSIWGQWVAGLLEADPRDPKVLRGPSITLSVELFISALSNDTYGRFRPNASTFDDFFPDIGRWFAYHLYYPLITDTSGNTTSGLNQSFVDSVLLEPAKNCPDQACQAFGQTGNQDLGGIGVVTSYYVEAILGTAFLIAFTVHQLHQYFNRKMNKIPQPTGNRGFRGRMLDAFRGSLNSFFIGAILVAVAVQGASIYSNIAAKETRSDTNKIPIGKTFYDMSLVLITSVFSVFPVMLLYPLVEHNGHRNWLHRSAAVTLWGLCATVVYLAPRAEYDYNQRREERTGSWCDKRGSRYWHVVKAAQFLVIDLPILWLVLTIFVTTGFRIPGMVDKPWLKRWRSVWRFIIAWVNLCVMWGILAYLTHFRKKIMNDAGGLDESDDWTFGQVLALTAWLPVLVELIYILAFGPENDRSGTPDDYLTPSMTQSEHTLKASPPNGDHDKQPVSTISLSPVTPSPATPFFSTASYNPGYQPIYPPQQTYA